MYKVSTDENTEDMLLLLEVNGNAIPSHSVSLLLRSHSQLFQDLFPLPFRSANLFPFLPVSVPIDLTNTL